ncbi:hypothetical protein HL667_19370 [Bradyrhizobium sp. 83012]|uniref:Uncharacterized protein n=1 Tax=Bradyrhizobium aeschynomenes TaxID=2734909 RepID=A0ABX2CG44_9BRAD|nr:hypothetical protein [Bradyrhizobium aeschynomenes]NPU67173.1 hypothetical protein [Bradyrhizobium aeschynomenes]
MAALTTRPDVLEPAQIAQTTTMMLTALLGGDEGLSPLSARGRRRLRIARLLETEARIDAALELIALQLPQWQLRRVAYDDGEWYCALSQQRELPDWLDRCAEAHHSDLALAILHAAAEARRLGPSVSPPGARRGVTAEAGVGDLLCCDNF